MKAEFTDNLHVLTNALRQEGFRFILIGHNRYSLYKDIAEYLQYSFTDRPFIELRFRDKTYRQIADEILAFPHGVMLIPDFDWLLQPANETVRVAFNQRRDAFARRNVAFICFIEPSSWRSLSEKLPDWWSLRSLELDFHREVPDIDIDFINSNEIISSLGGETKTEKEEEIVRLIKQLDTIEPTNNLLRQSLYDQLGKLSFELSDYEGAYKYLQQHLIIRQEIGDKSGEGRIFNNISQIYKARGDHATALTYLQQSLRISQEVGDKQGEATTLNNISQIYDVWGDYETALTYLQQSLRISQEIGNKRGEGTTLNNLAGIAHSQGDYATALTYLQRSLSISQEVGNKIGEVTTLNNISHIYKARGNYTTTLTYLQDGLRISQEIGNKRGEATILNNIGILYFEQFQNVERAVGYLMSSYQINKQLDSPNAEVSKDYLDRIEARIGEARFQQILQSIQDQPLP